MGFKKRNKNKQKQGEPKPQKDYVRTEPFSDLLKENKTFEHFYTEQNVMPKEEIPEFLEALKRPLPQTFRFAGFKNSAKLLMKRMEENFLENFQNLEIDGVKITKPSQIPWYPNGLAWSTSLSRTQLRRHPNLGEMHRFLIAESEAGYVTRQEEVSMIPPLFMDIKSDQAILDLCAAPGSKTSQIIELMHEHHDSLSAQEQAKLGGSKIPTGFCIANDKNNKRCYMLVHQAKRLNSPSCIITNHDASAFPGLVTKDANSESPDEFIPLEFDRVLADVPCTGDGTMRKNFDIWKTWTPENSTSLHPTQVKILKRALELLKVGGKVIYSTCSLSPLEDEAVVGHVLSLCQGAASLEDCSKVLPNLKRRKGINNWKLLLKDGKWYDKFEDTQTQGKTHITRSMFPPENAVGLNLDRCMRFLPHDQDTGGFFVCVIEKTSKLPWESDRKKSLHIARSAEENDNQPPCKKVKQSEKYRHGVYNEDPFYFFDDADNNKTINEVLEFFNFNKSNFPSNLLLSRSDHSKVESPKHIYLASPMVKQVLQYNAKRLYLINSGVRVFCRTQLPNTYHPYRITNDGLDVLIKYLPLEENPRCIGIGSEDMTVLLQSEYPKFSEYSPQLKQDHAKMVDKVGCIIVYLKQDIEIDSDSKVALHLTGWRGQTESKESLRAYIDKFDRRHYLHLIGAEIPDEIDLNKSKIRKEVQSDITNKENEKND